MYDWWRKLTRRLPQDQFDSELQEEMRTHLEMKAAATGDEPAARRQFGNTTLLLEDAREAWAWPWAESAIRDFRHAMRGLAKRPGFAATVILTLAVGIGATSTIYSLIDTVLLRPLPYPDSGRLVMVEETKSGDSRSRTRVAPGRLQDWQRLNKRFSAIAGSSSDTLTDTTLNEPERLAAEFVSPQFLAVLGVSPAIGRAFSPEEERFGGPAAVVISDAFWRRRFHADPAVLGRRLILAGKSHAIVGVMPPDFHYPSPETELWAPRQAPAEFLAIREARIYQCIGRLKPGVSPETAEADLAAIQQRLGVQYPKTDAGWSAAIQPLRDRMVGSVRLGLWLLFGSAGILLLIACANVACLLLARVNSRSAEMATRRALGAGRAAIARQLFAEGLAYALAGGVLGVGAAVAAIDAVRDNLAGLPRIAELTLDFRIVAAVAGIVLFAAVAFSLAPIVQTFRASLAPGARGLIGGRQSLARFLVSAQLALATALLITAGLFLQSLVRAQDAPLGFQPDRVLSFRVGASFGELPDLTVQRHQRILDAVATLPGVKSVAMSTGLPSVNPTWPREFEIENEATPDGSLRFTTWRIVTAGYFQTLGIPILDGRTCRMSTDQEHPFQALVNRRFADRYFPGRNPLGRRIAGGPQGDVSTEIVGITADAHEDGHSIDPQPLIYVCGYLRYWPDSQFLVSTANPPALAGAVRAAVRATDPTRPVYAMQPMEAALGGALTQTRFRVLLVTLFSAMALALAAIGLYGVMTYAVAERVREIGLRVALGARPAQIAAQVLRSAAILAGGGAAAGIAIAAAASRTMQSLLYGIGASDIATYALAVAVLLAVALLACIIPSRRATSIDPTEALRPQ